MTPPAPSREAGTYLGMPRRPATHRPSTAAARLADTRPSACKRGYDRQWRKRRLSFLADNPLCVVCLAAGHTTEATVADHVTPHKGDPEAFRSGALQALCETCHNRKTVLSDGGFGRTPAQFAQDRPGSTRPNPARTADAGGDRGTGDG